MEQGKAWRGYPALSKPLTLMGVERRWFLLSATLGLAMWNAINSIVTGSDLLTDFWIRRWLVMAAAGTQCWPWKQENLADVFATQVYSARALAPWAIAGGSGFVPNGPEGAGSRRLMERSRNIGTKALNPSFAPAVPEAPTCSPRMARAKTRGGWKSNAGTA